MTWDRHLAASSLVSIFETATGVQVHSLPPEVLNPPCVVISRPTVVQYSTAAFSVDEATLPVIIVHGIEQEAVIDALRKQCRAAVEANPTLFGTVKAAWPTEERNWRNITGAGGIQLLTVELILTIHM